MMNLREVEVFKPYSNEFPEEMLLAEREDEAFVDAWLNAEILRVGKRGEEVLGVYAMNRIDSVNFELLGVIVSQRVRKQGLGRWLVGHAIGVAESKGGRYLHLKQTGSSRTFVNVGFVKDKDQWTFEMIQE